MESDLADIAAESFAPPDCHVAADGPLPALRGPGSHDGCFDDISIIACEGFAAESSIAVPHTVDPSSLNKVKIKLTNSRAEVHNLKRQASRMEAKLEQQEQQLAQFRKAQDWSCDLTDCDATNGRTPLSRMVLVSLKRLSGHASLRATSVWLGNGKVTPKTLSDWEVKTACCMNADTQSWFDRQEQRLRDGDDGCGWGVSAIRYRGDGSNTDAFQQSSVRVTEISATYAFGQGDDLKAHIECWPDIQLILEKSGASTYELTRRQASSVRAPMFDDYISTASEPPGKLIFRWTLATTDGGGDEQWSRRKLRRKVDTRGPLHGYEDLDCQQHVASNGQKKYDFNFRHAELGEVEFAHQLLQSDCQILIFASVEAPHFEAKTAEGLPGHR